MPASSHTRVSRILMTADTVGGVWTYALQLARALGSYDVHITVATMGAALSRAQRQEVSEVANVEICESKYRLEWMNEPWKDVAAAGEWLLELEQRVQPDLIHLNNYAHGALPFTAPVLIVGHSCVLSWWRAVRTPEAPAEWNRYREAVTAGLRAADLVAAPSQAMLSALQEHYGPLPATRVIPNGSNFFTTAAKPKDSFVLAVGRLWDPAKNIATLNAVAPGLSWPVFVAGDAVGPDGCGVEHTNIRHLGRLAGAELAGWFERASIYAFPARYEPFGLSVLEAALAGCALVLGDIPSLRENWGEAAIFVPPDDRAALLKILNQLAGEPAQRAQMGARARASAARFTPEKMAGNYWSAYSELARRSQPSKASTAYGLDTANPNVCTCETEAVLNGTLPR